MEDRIGEGKKFLGLGWILLDFCMFVESFPRENTKIAANARLEQVGGPVARALMQVSRFGGGARLYGAVGSDDWGRRCLDELRQFNIDTEGVTVRARSSTRVGHVWLANDSGTRTISYSRDGPEPEPDLTIDRGSIDEAAAVLMDGRHVEHAVQVARIAQEMNTVVAVDMGGFRDNLPSLLESATIIIGSESTWERLAQVLGLKSEQVLVHYGDAICVRTSGDSVITGSDRGEQFEYVPVPVTVRDSNGAGDVFFGAFTWAIVVNRMASADATRFAATAAAIKCQRIGNEGLPSLADIRKVVR